MYIVTFLHTLKLSKQNQYNIAIILHWYKFLVYIYNLNLLRSKMMVRINYQVDIEMSENHAKEKRLFMAFFHKKNRCLTVTDSEK